MAITRTQIAKQLLAQGGRTGFQGGGADLGAGASGMGSGSRDRDTGSDYGQFDRAVSRSQNNPNRTTPSGNGGGGNKVDVGFQEALRKQKIEKKKKEARDKGFRTTGSIKYSPPTFFQNLKNKSYQSAIDRNKYLALQKTGLIPGGGFKGFAGSLIDGFFGKVPENLQDLSEEELTELAFEVQKFKDAGGPTNQATYNYNLNPTKKGSGLELLGRTFDAQDLLDSGQMTQTKFEELFPGPNIPKDRDGPQDPCLGPNPPAYCFTGIRSAEPEVEDTEYVNPLSKLTPRIAGTQFEAAGGGIASLEDMDREGFLLGGIAKGLKKAVRGIKKLAKSPIGKAALGFAAFKYGPQLLSGKGFSLGTAKKFSDLKFFGERANVNPFRLAGIPAILAGAMTPKEDKDKFDIDSYYAANQLNPSQSIRGMGSEFDFYGGERMRVAEGGSTEEKEPVAKKTMPLLDMDGMEKDYREEGGFVPIGRMEKADDVPARLSKNEFVFTADAVRNAGDGDVDKGAEVMYNMMKNLESGGEVSEESQGLEGARKMFQTSQRLEEVL